MDLFSIVPVKRSHSVCAQGGINAAKNLKGEGDSTWKHFDDTIYGGDFLANQPPVKDIDPAAPHAELSAGGVASILVPFPHAVDDHQTANARFLADRGAAILLPQRELTPKGLAEMIGSLDRAALLKMAQNARALGKPDAARVVAERCMELAETPARRAR